MATVNLSSIITPANVLTASNAETLTNKTINIASNTLTGVQPTLVSGTSIKTVNGTTVLGSGNLSIDSGAQGFVTQYQGPSAAPTMNSFSIALI